MSRVDKTKKLTGVHGHRSDLRHVDMYACDVYSSAERLDANVEIRLVDVDAKVYDRKKTEKRCQKCGRRR